MVRTDTGLAIDWVQCELIERVPGKVSWRPIVRGTRILPDAIVNSSYAGESLDLIHENYPGLSILQMQRLIEFAQGQTLTARPCCGAILAITKFSWSDIRAGRG